MNSDFGTQLFNSMTAINLKMAQNLRPLSPAEKSLLEASEAKAGDMLPKMVHHMEQNPFKETI